METEILARSGSSTFSLQLASVRRWVAHRLGNLKHERRVLQTAVRLFDMTAHRHGLGLEHRRLLKLGALLHDVGRYHGTRKHHLTGARMILKSRTLPLTARQRPVVAYLARHHRGEVPAEVGAMVLPEGVKAGDVAVLLAILRAADTLDNRRLSQPMLVLKLKGERLRIRCHVGGQWRRARRAFRRRHKFRMLKQMLGIRVKVRVKRADLETSPALAA